jgi:hypothetical protein
LAAFAALGTWPRLASATSDPLTAFGLMCLDLTALRLMSPAPISPAAQTAPPPRARKTAIVDITLGVGQPVANATHGAELSHPRGASSVSAAPARR